MKLNLSSAVFTAFLLPTIAVAATDPQASTTKLNMNQVAEMLGSLKSLDGYTKVVKDGDREVPVQTAYQLGGGLRLVIAHDIAKLNEALNEYRAGRLAMQAEQPGAEKPGSDAWKKLQVEETKSALAPFDYADIRHIRADELKLDVNPIPASVLSGLEPILDQ